MELSRSQRGKLVLLYEGYEYIKHREDPGSGVVTWRCREYHVRTSHCRAFIRTKGNTALGDPGTHSHDSLPQKAQANVIVSKMKEDIKTIGATPKNVIGNALINVSNDVLHFIPKQASLARNLLRHRGDMTIPKPTSCNFDTPNIKILTVPAQMENASTVQHLVTNTINKSVQDNNKKKNNDSAPSRRASVTNKKNELVEVNNDSKKANDTAKQPLPEPEDSITMYTKYLGVKLNQFDAKTQATLIHKINELIYNAEMQLFADHYRNK